MDTRMSSIKAQQRAAELRQAGERSWRHARDRSDEPAPRRLSLIARLALLQRRLRSGEAGPGPHPRQAPVQDAITLRLACSNDEAALARLAQLDSANPLEQPVLLALVSGELRAALSLSDGRVVADPFHRAAAVVELLVQRARQFDGAGDARRSGGLRSRSGLAVRPARTL